LRTVTVLTTGGTIASRQSAGGGARATDDVTALLDQVSTPGDVTVQGREVLRVNSFAITPQDMRTVLAAVEESLSDPGVDGVVITHGTDTMEETALFVDLFHTDDRPVVFTGDQPDPDGPVNVSDAIAVAAAAESRGLGVLLVFAGGVYAAQGTRKTRTMDLAAFDNPETGALGRVDHGRVSIANRPLRGTVGDVSALAAELPRVDIVAIYPGVDAAALTGVVSAGARGLVLEATGSGNANPAVVRAVGEFVAAGGVVVVSTRVHSGPVTALYTGGGGVDLVAAGAVLAGSLRPGQARIALIALLALGAGPEEISRTLAATTARPT
jgi:L-asparaginase